MMAGMLAVATDVRLPAWTIWAVLSVVIVAAVVLILSLRRGRR